MPAPRAVQRGLLSKTCAVPSVAPQQHKGEDQRRNCRAYPQNGFGSLNDKHDEFHSSSLNVDTLFTLERVRLLVAAEPAPAVEALEAIE